MDSLCHLLPNETYQRHTREFIQRIPLSKIFDKHKNKVSESSSSHNASHNQLYKNNNNLETIQNTSLSHDLLKWTYKLHSFINFFRFLKHLKTFLSVFSRTQIEVFLNNYCVSMEMDSTQKLNCVDLVNSKIESALQDKQPAPELEEENVTFANISFQEVHDKYTISDTNIITKNDWGPSIWNTIHFLAANVKDATQMKHYQDFVRSLSYLLPCAECRKHMRENLIVFPPEFLQMTPFQWSWKFHNSVNSQVKKPIVPFSETLLQKYLVNSSVNETFKMIPQ
jgi:hypothetical protein